MNTKGMSEKEVEEKLESLYMIATTATMYHMYPQANVAFAAIVKTALKRKCGGFEFGILTSEVDGESVQQSDFDRLCITWNGWNVSIPVRILTGTFFSALIKHEAKIPVWRRSQEDENEDLFGFVAPSPKEFIELKNLFNKTLGGTIGADYLVLNEIIDLHWITPTYYKFVGKESDTCISPLVKAFRRYDKELVIPNDPYYGYLVLCHQNMGDWEKISYDEWLNIQYSRNEKEETAC